MFATKMLASKWGSLKTQKRLFWTIYVILALENHIYMYIKVGHGLQKLFPIFCNCSSR